MIRTSAVVTIAPLLSSEANGGHVFWMHQAFQTSFSKIPGLKYITIGPKKFSPDWAVGSLSLSPKMRQRLSHFPLIGMNADIRNVEHAVSNCFNQTELIHLHVYDGGFREYILVSRLLSRNPLWTVSFNFGNWQDPWTKVLLKIGKSTRRWIDKLFLRIFSNPRIFNYAETRALSELFPGTPVSVKIYPSFSAFPSAVMEADPMTSVAKARGIDVIFFPESAEELDLCLDVVEKLVPKVDRRLTLAIQPRWEFEISGPWVDQVRQFGISLFPRLLGMEDYVQMFRESKIVLLPYKRLSHYKYQGSGRLRDAITMGCRVLVPEGTALGELAEVYNSVWAVNLGDSEEIAKLLCVNLELPQVPGVAAFTPLSSANEIVRVSEEFVNQKRLGADKAFGFYETLALGTAYLTLDWYQPIVGIAKVIGLPSQVLSRIRNILESWF
jgi:hypothetical protein